MKTGRFKVGCLCKLVEETLTKLNSPLIQHQYLNFLFLPHNAIVIILGRDKNFPVSRLYELRNGKREKNSFLFYSPFMTRNL